MKSSMKLINLINQAIVHKKLYCYVPYSKLNISILCNLLKDGYIYAMKLRKVHQKNMLCVKLKYHHNISVLKNIKIVSVPSQRKYWNHCKLKSHLMIYRGKKYMISTSKGLLTSDQALNEKIGGELLIEYN